MAVLCPGCRLTIRKELPKCPMCGADLANAEQGAPSAQVASPAAADQALLYSGFWRRVVACIIDSTVISVIRAGLVLLWGIVAAGSLIGASSIGTEAIVGMFVASVVALVLVTLAVGVVYHSYFESSPYRATPGKLVMQAYVADLSGAPISFSTALIRNVSKILSALILGIGYLLPAFTSQKQALHDMLASTLVLKKPEATAGRFIAGVVLAFVLSAISHQISKSSKDSRPRNFDFRTKSSATQQPSNLGMPGIIDEPVLDETENPETSLSETPEAEASPNSASVTGKSLELPHQIAFLKRNGGEILVGLFAKPISESQIDRLKQLAADPDPTKLGADVTLGFKFSRSNTECSAEDLSSYYVIFRGSPSGFVLPEKRETIEFARAVTSERSREGIALNCQKTNGSSLVAAMKGSGGKIPNETTPAYLWNLAFKTELIELN